MPIAAALILTAAAGYLLGCCNGAILVSKYILHDDIRQHGSGNAGLTNFYRVFGGKTTVLVILSDMLKMIIAIAVGAALVGAWPVPLFGKLWAAMFCMLGHDFPFMFGFKGGKGVLSGGAMILVMDWRVAIIAWGLFIVIVALTRYVSLGSMLAAAAFAVFISIFHPFLPDIIVAVFCASLLIWGHRTNIRRLVRGEENKFSFHKKKS